MEELYNIPVRSLPGVGEAKSAAYAKLGVKTLYDLIYFFPRAYENRGCYVPITAGRKDVKCSVILTVDKEPSVAKVKSGIELLKFTAFDDSGSCVITYFNQNYLKDKFIKGHTYRFYGKVDTFGRNYQMTSPVFEEWDETAPLPDLYPVYRLADGLSQKQIQKDINSILPYAKERIKDIIPDSVRSGNGLCTLSYALGNIHSPADYEALAVAKKRLIFDEFFLFALGIATAKKRVREGGGHPCLDNDISKLLSCFPYPLTGAQKRTVDEIRSDMTKETPMRRIVVGDVGCGKTVCAMAALYIAAMSGRQAALMVPTEILARQHFADIAPVFAKLGIRTALLTGSTKTNEKKEIKRALSEEDESRRLQVVIGTHALLSDGVEFACPGVIVTDEQHRFGVGQRAALAGKNQSAHVLVMSATPIPRSMALTMYGDLDISKIDEMPPGRQKVDTFVVDESYRERLDRFILKICSEGGQVYIVCPSIEEKTEENEISLSEVGIANISSISINDKTPLKAAEVYSEELKTKLPTLNIGLVHGKMKTAEKDAIMAEFQSGRCQVLVSTTVIEVGVNIPNACLMIVENAERFGLSQLHQLRGRVGRGNKKSYCILVSDTKNAVSRQRLDTMKTVYDGYLIAEKDLAMRGPGDFVNSSSDGEVRQSGGVRFRLAGQCDDPTLMAKAMAVAGELAEKDRSLESYPGLADAMAAMFSPDTDDIS